MNRTAADPLSQLKRARDLGAIDPPTYDFFASAAAAILTGSGAVAQGQEALAVGRAGVGVRGDNSGTINTGTQFKIDQLSLQFLQPLDLASGLASAIAPQLAQATAPIGAPTPAALQLRNLVEELRRTHKTLVDLLDPLWDIDDVPATFAAAFKPVYRQFRRFYNGNDLGNSRTHCHIIRSIRDDLHSARPRGGADEAAWAQMEGILAQLGNSDQDIIEARYRPFMRQVYEILGDIDALLNAQPPDVAQAIQIKRALQDKLQDGFDATKAKFEEMNDTIDRLDDVLRASR